jgi:DNA helicase-2/ATP-dependent DNA helicase PcrA
MRNDCLGLSLPEMVEIVVDKSGLKAYYETERDGQDRLENLNELVTAAAGFVAEASFEVDEAPDAGVTQPATENVDPRLRELNEFLAHASLEAGEHQASAGADALQLMTVHAAKGLEFHTVFMSGLEEGLFPHENSLSQQDGIEEERRLMYVALTRARRRLHLSFAQSRMLHGQTRYNVASRFLEEIPDQLIKRVNASRAVGLAFGGLPPTATRNAGAGALDVAAAVPWRIGQSVLHPKFGPGVIVSAEGRGADARVQVNFRNAGLKWLALEYAKLTAG